MSAILITPAAADTVLVGRNDDGPYYAPRDPLAAALTALRATEARVRRLCCPEYTLGRLREELGMLADEAKGEIEYVELGREVSS